MQGQNKPAMMMINIVTNLFFREMDAIIREKSGQTATGQNMMIIRYLAHQKKDVYQKDIENHFSVRRSTVSKTLRIMEEKQMITRRTVDGDARLRKIELTEKGKQLYLLSEYAIQCVEQKLYEGITEEEISSLKQILYKLEKNMLK